MKYDFITIGGAAEDISFLTGDGLLLDNKKDILRQKLLAFEYGAKIEIDKVYYSFGGGAANAAVCLARLGFRTANIGTIGDDERGRRILENFKKQGVDNRLVQKIKGKQTSFSFILVSRTGERIIFFSREAERKLRIRNYELRILRNAKWIYVTSFSGKWQNNLKKIFSIKTKIAWNPGNAQLQSGVRGIGGYLKKTEVLIVNKDEAIELAVSDKKNNRKGRKFLDNIKNLLEIIYGYGPNIAVITDGINGARAYDGKNFYYQPVVKEKKRMDTTGVGDAFGSSFVAGMELYKGDIKKSMFLGARNAASVIAKVGAQNGLLSRKNI